MQFIIISQILLDMCLSDDWMIDRHALFYAVRLQSKELD
jgi:hypothetical protein